MLCVRHHHYFHFKEDIEAQRGEIICLSSHSPPMAELGWEASQSCFGDCALNDFRVDTLEGEGTAVGEEFTAPRPSCR